MGKPKIRFKGYTDDWEQRKLEEVVEFLDTMRKPLEGAKRIPGPYPYYGASGIVDYVDGYLFDEELVLLSEDGANITDRNYPVCFLASGKYWVNNHAHVLRTKDGNENNFICNSLERKDYKQYNSGMAMPKLNQEVCRGIPISCPSFDEQRKIGGYFRGLDHLITLHQRKCEETKKLKKYMLQKMFPQDGQVVPEIRFKGFTDAWEQRKLGDVIEKLTGGASITPDDYVDAGYRTIPKGAVNSSGVADMSGCKNVSEYFFKKNISSKTSSGELVTSLRDLVPTAPNMGRIVRICGETEDFLMPQGVYSIIVKEKISEDFLITYSNSPEYRKIIMAEKNGSTQVHMRNGEFLNIDIPLPSYEEQKKVGDYFRSLDHLITLHQNKCNELQNMKKFMLKNMFV